MDLRSHLITDAQYFYQQGWMMGTAGNLSARLPDGSFWITASGRMKGALTLEDFVRVDADGRVVGPAGLKPSAETRIHQVLYHRFPESQACYHVHSVAANLVSRLQATETIPLPPLEMLKGLGIWVEHPDCEIAVFPNHLNVEQIATAIAQRFERDPPDIPALLIRDHRLTVWASSIASARNFVELLEYVFRYIVMAYQLKLGESM